MRGELVVGGYLGFEWVMEAGGVRVTGYNVGGGRVINGMRERERENCNDMYGNGGNVCACVVCVCVLNAVIMDKIARKSMIGSFIPINEYIYKGNFRGV